MYNYLMAPMYMKDSLITFIYVIIFFGIAGVIGYLYVDNIAKQKQIESLCAEIVQYKEMVNMERKKNEGLLSNRRILDDYYESRPDFVITGEKPKIEDLFTATPR